MEERVKLCSVKRTLNAFSKGIGSCQPAQSAQADMSQNFLLASKLLPRIDDSHCDRIHSSLTAVRCFDNGYLGKQPVAWKEYWAEYWIRELRESMNRCTGRIDITKLLLKTALNTIQSINQNFCMSNCHCT